MAIIALTGLEMGTFADCDSTAGTISVSSGVKHTGAYSARANPGATYGRFILTSATTKRLSAYFYIDSTPDSEIAILGSTNAVRVNVRLTTDRYLKLYSGSTQKGDTGSTQLDEDTWYRISVSLDPVTVNDPCKVYINGNEEISTITSGCVSTPSQFGVISTCTADIYIDDCIADDTDSTDDLGNIRLQLAQPNANGDANNFDTDTDGGADHYTFYDDNAGSLDDADYVMHAAKTQVQDIANLESSSQAGLGASDTINAVRICYRWKLSKAGDTLPDVYVKDDGTGYATTVPRDSGNVWYWDFKLYATNAPRGTAWTQAIFDAFQAGMQSSGDGADVYLSCIMVMVAYIPVGVTDYPISLSPGLTASATVAYAVAWDRGMSPGLTASATLARALAYDRGTSPGLTVSTTIAKALGRLITTTANLTVSSTVARFMTYTRATTSNLTASATVVKSWGRKIATIANLVVSTTIAMSKGFVRAVTSNLTASATVSKAVAYNRATTAGLTVSATIARIVAYHIATQTVLSVAISIVKSFGRTITTATGLTVSVTIVKSWGRTITTSAGLTASVTISRVVTYKRAVSSGLTTAVTIAKSFGKKIATASNLAVSVTVSRVVAYKRATQPALSVAVSVARSFGRTITTTTNLVVSVVVIAVKETGIRLARAWGIIFG